jgi:hypothetical protein
MDGTGALGVELAFWYIRPSSVVLGFEPVLSLRVQSPLGHLATGGRLSHPNLQLQGKND